MASISKQPNGRRTIQFTAETGKRHSIRLGKISQRNAEAIKARVERILEAQFSRQALDADTAQWLGEIDDSLHSKLAKVGLVESREEKAVQALGAYLDDYVARRIDVKPATKIGWGHAVRNLREFFGENRDLVSITEGDAEDFKMHLLGQNLASATISKRLKNARMFFAMAKKRKLITDNPFAGVGVPAGTSPERQHFVTMEDTKKLLAVSNPTWRTIIALCRFGGLRCPSEVLSLKWEHVLWDSSRIVIQSPKTERHEGKESRVAPLFPELLPILLEASEMADDGAEYVVGGNYREAAQSPAGWGNCNLRTQFERIIDRAGLVSWPRLFHNLRASRETELVKNHPIHVVAAWLGNTPTIAARHYLQVTDADFERAIEPAEKSGGKSGAEVGKDAVQNVVQPMHAGTRQNAEDPPETPITKGVEASPGELQTVVAKEFNGPYRARTGDLFRVKDITKAVLHASKHLFYRV